MRLQEMTSGATLTTTKVKMAIEEGNSSRTNLIASDKGNKPIGIKLFGYCFKFKSEKDRRNYYKILILLLTYIAYAAFHMGRRPLSVVKNVLNRNCSEVPQPPHSGNNAALVSGADQDGVINFDLVANQNDNTFDNAVESATIVGYANTTDPQPCNWAPFDDDKTANQLLATLDTSFLLSYALLMFFSGYVADRANLRYFITISMIFSGILLIAFGLAKPLEIHSMTYFVSVQIISGVFQSGGWPAVVTCVNNWFGPEKMGLIFGIWNSTTSVGNILGAVLSGLFVETDWALSFFVPGGIMILLGLVLFLFLVPSPKDVNMSEDLMNGQPKSNVTINNPPVSNLDQHMDSGSEDEASDGMSTTTSQRPCYESSSHKHDAVSFFTALRIPGVIEYSLCLFFSKLVSYTFLYWLPRFINSSTSFDSEDSAYLSVPFDIGGIAGGILAGFISDKTKASGTTCMVMLITAIPSMFAYQKYGPASSLNNITLQLLTGILVNGPYSLITTAVSADLGTRIKDGRAMATVAAIIDGMGSIGAVVGPLFAGFASNSGDWQAVFMMLMLSDVFASICLIRVTIHEIKEKFRKPNPLPS